jgi:hypothetical protein
MHVCTTWQTSLYIPAICLIPLPFHCSPLARATCMRCCNERHSTTLPPQQLQQSQRTYLPLTAGGGGGDEAAQEAPGATAYGNVTLTAAVTAGTRHPGRFFHHEHGLTFVP